MSELLRLLSLYLYGNPLLGPTGEDPLQIYIEDFVNLCQDYREAHQGKPLNVRGYLFHPVVSLRFVSFLFFSLLFKFDASYCFAVVGAE